VKPAGNGDVFGLRGKGEIGDDKNIRQMKNINKSVRSVSNGSRKVFCEVVKRANLFKATPHNSRLVA
jgi:hypothetical protein